MKFKAEVGKLIKFLTLANKIKNYVKLSVESNKCICISTENEINKLKLMLEVEEADGNEAILDLKMLLPILQKAKNNIQFDNGIITFSGSKFKVPYIDNVEISKIDDNIVNDLKFYDGNNILNAISKVKYAKDITTNALNGVHIGKNECVGLSGVRLVKYPCIENDIDSTLSDELLIDLYKTFYSNNIKCCKKSNKIIFFNERFVFTTAVFSSQFPKYEQLLPTEFINKIKINKEEFIDALNICTATVDDKTFKGCFEIKNNVIKITVKNIYCTGETSINCESDVDHTINLNIGHLLEIMNNFSGENIYINLTNGVVTVITSDDINDYALVTKYQ